MLPDDDKRYAIETCRSSESVLKKWFKINDIQLVHLLVVWYLVNSNYMFRPLEAIFRLHKIELEDRDIIPVRKADNLTAILCRCHEIWEP